MKTIIKIFFVFLSFSCFYNVNAQALQAVRLEVPADINIESYHVQQLGKRGVLIFYESNELDADRKRKWYFALFDIALKQQWLKFVTIEDKSVFTGHATTNTKLHLLFSSSSGGRNDNNGYEIVSLDFLKNDFEQISGTFPAKAEIVGFEVIGQTACLGINKRSDETDLLFVNLLNGEINPLSIATEYPSRIGEVYAGNYDRNFYVSLKIKSDNRYIDDYIYQINTKAKTLAAVKIELDDNTKVIHKLAFHQSSKNDLTVLGVYDLPKGRVNDLSKLFEEDDPRTAGLVFFKFNKELIKDVKFYDFSQFDNIHSSISRSKPSARKVVNSSEGKVKTVSSFFNINRPYVVKTDKGFMFSVEVYKPHYITETRMDYDFYGRPYPYSYSVFDGYVFYDVIISELDNNGNLLWNNDFVFRDLKSFSLQRHSFVFADGEYVNALYVNEGKIFSKLIKQSIDVNKDEIIIASGNSKDRIVEDENNHIMKWYDNFFLIYGYQKINNRSLSRKNERIVFYMNKVAYK